MKKKLKKIQLLWIFFFIFGMIVGAMLVSYVRSNNIKSIKTYQNINKRPANSRGDEFLKALNGLAFFIENNIIIEIRNKNNIRLLYAKKGKPHLEKVDIYNVTTKIKQIENYKRKFYSLHISDEVEYKNMKIIISFLCNNNVSENNIVFYEIGKGNCGIGLKCSNTISHLLLEVMRFMRVM